MGSFSLILEPQVTLLQHWWGAGWGHQMLWGQSSSVTRPYGVLGQHYIPVTSGAPRGKALTTLRYTNKIIFNTC